MRSLLVSNLDDYRVAVDLILCYCLVEMVSHLDLLANPRRETLPERQVGQVR
jgi:hypothetical protein